MNRLLILAPALLLAFPAVAQDAPPAGYQSLWCHLAFAEMSAQIPPLPAEDLAAAHAAGDAATPEQQELLSAEMQIKQVMDGIPFLLDAATASYTEAGFTAEQVETAKAELTPKVSEQITASGGSGAEFTFLQCLELLPAAETTTQ